MFKYERTVSNGDTTICTAERAAVEAAN